MADGKKVLRNAKGQLRPGTKGIHQGNPDGSRPRGLKRFVDILAAELDQPFPASPGLTQAQVLAARIVREAISGNVELQKALLNKILPAQVDVDTQVTQVRIVDFASGKGLEPGTHSPPVLAAQIATADEPEVRAEEQKLPDPPEDEARDDDGDGDEIVTIEV